MRRILALTFLLVLVAASAFASGQQYQQAVKLGGLATDEAAHMLAQDFHHGGMIVVTNAGYASPGGLCSLGSIDGLASATGSTLGSGTLIPVQSRFDQPLWFAFYDQKSGKCAYLEADPDKAAAMLSGGDVSKDAVFGVAQMERIDAAHLFAEPEAFKTKAKHGLFGDNLFRIVTIANAAAKGCPAKALKSIQVHDHYCPGVTSGVILAEYVRKHILVDKPKAKCFVLGLQPWCKEDALLVLLNATPGKRSYGVVYPKKEDNKNAGPLAKADTAVFVLEENGPWKGWLLAFDFASAKKQYQTRDYGFAVIDKLHADLWFLERMDTPEEFVSVVKEVELPESMEPKDLLRPGSDPLAVLAAM
jgi:formylmethanofuran dehydrogenase subunit E-like metal-binding protein